jgi:hypothetical protein
MQRKERVMECPHLRPIDAVARGALAGAAGALAMDLVWFSRYKRSDGKSSFLEWEFSTEPDWDAVSAPGQLGKRLAGGFLQRKLDP